MRKSTEVYMREPNQQDNVVRGFGDEWRRFTQSKLTQDERETIFHDYFSIFPWEIISNNSSIGADIGCGSGRWALIVAPRVKKLHLIDASYEALNVAQNNLKSFNNIEYHNASVGKLPMQEKSLDFAYSLGVLHHVPDTQSAINEIAKKLHDGAPFLLYLYYNFDNRSTMYRALWRLSDFARLIISKMPYPLRYFSSQLIATSVYWPLARIARLLEYINLLPRSWPLSYYRDKSFYTMRTDALDRFGTSLEKRFSKNDIYEMLSIAGFENIKFSEHEPYWCAVGIKKKLI